MPTLLNAYRHRITVRQLPNGCIDIEQGPNEFLGTVGCCGDCVEPSTGTGTGGSGGTLNHAELTATSLKWHNSGHTSEEPNQIAVFDGSNNAAYRSVDSYDNAGTAAGLLSAHEAASDPHPQYLTAAEGDALFLTPAEGDAAYQPLDGDLTTIAALTTTGFLVRTGATTWLTRTIAGTSNRIAVSNGSGVSAGPIIDIDSAYVGQATITTLGTIATGTWQGTKVGLAYGGTNADLSATGAAKSYLKQSSSGAAITVGTIPAGDYPTFVQAGASHAVGGVPDPGATAHTNFPFSLRDDGTFKINTGEVLGSSYVTTSQTTTSTSLTDLATTMSVAFTLDAAGVVIVTCSCTLQNNTANVATRFGVDVDGTDEGDVAIYTVPTANVNFTASKEWEISLGSGAHTLKMQFSVGSNTGTFLNRLIKVIRKS